MQSEKPTTLNGRARSWCRWCCARRALRSCREPVAGAGISISGRLRVPLGSSDDAVARAERLQTTLGEGPCLAAIASADPLMADLESIAVCWPMFHHQLVAQTPFRSVVALPLFSPRERLRCGALDLYLTTPDSEHDFSNAFIAEVMSAVADPIAGALFDERPVDQPAAEGLIPWLGNRQARDRMHVWAALGILIEHSGLSDTAALAALRGYAFSHDTSLDDVADDLRAERLAPEAVMS